MLALALHLVSVTVCLGARDAVPLLGTLPAAAAAAVQSRNGNSIQFSPWSPPATGPGPRSAAANITDKR